MGASLQPKSKHASLQWKLPSSPSTKKFKVMLTMFWGSQGVLLAHFQNHGETVNSASYYEGLLKLQDAVHRKCSGQLTRGYCFIMTKSDPIQPEQPKR
jgi:hypothetical protein